MVAARVFLVLLLSLSASSTGRCADIDMSAFGISQARPAHPSIRVYLNLRDTRGEPPQTLKPEQFHVTVGRHDAVVSTIRPFKESNEGTAFIFMVDVSKSLNATQFGQIRKSLSDWAEAMDDKDRAAILTFGTTVKVVRDFTADISDLKARIAELAPTDQNTQLHLAFTNALEMGRRRDADLPARRAIVVLSDGHDDCDDGKPRQTVMDAIREYRVPIYAIGLCEKPCGQDEKENLKSLGAFASASGGAYFRAGSQPFPEIYEKLRELIRGVSIATVHCAECEWDGNLYRLQVTLATETRSVTDGVDVRLLPPPPMPEPEPATAAEPPQRTESRAPRTKPGPALTNRIYAIGGVLILSALWLWIRIRTRKSREDAPDTGPDDSETAGQKMPVSDTPPEESGIPIRLVKIGAGPQSETFDLQLATSVIIGRNPDVCDLGIAGDDEVSGKHCELIRERGMIFVRDLESRNGTFVNGVAVVGKQRLQDGDRILMGKSEFRLRTALSELGI